MRSLFIVACYAACATAVKLPEACCAFGGNGAAILSGKATVSLPTASGAFVPQIVPAVLASDGSSFSGVILNGTSPDSSSAGWIVSGNSTGQTIIVWTANPGAPPTCSRASAPPTSYVPTFAFCNGAGSL
jgi:hypothetical protein